MHGTERIVRFGLVTAIGVNFATLVSCPNLQHSDFAIFVASGRAVLLGSNPYPRIASPNLDPPAALPFFSLISRLPTDFAFAIMNGTSIVMFAITLGLLWREFRFGSTTALWVIAMPGIWETLIEGQIYAPLALATAAAWLLFRRHRMGEGGILIGLVVAIKPNFGVWPLLLLASGEVVAVAAAAVSFAILSLLPVILFGPAIYLEWVRVLGVGFVALPLNGTLTGMVARLGLPLLGWPVSLLLIAGAVTIVYLRPGSSAETISAISLLISLLASPVAWPGYLLFLLPVFLQAEAGGLRNASAALLAVPMVWIAIVYLYPSALLSATLGQLYTVALLLLLISVVRPLVSRPSLPVPFRD